MVGRACETCSHLKGKYCPVYKIYPPDFWYFCIEWDERKEDPAVTEDSGTTS